MKMQYKIGDHVVVEKSNVPSWNYGGKTGVITSIDPHYDYPYLIKMDDGRKCRNYGGKPFESFDEFKRLTGSDFIEIVE